MTRVAPLPPAETDLLCEFCGYTLNGLDDTLNCPECGRPIAASVGSKRQPPLWEASRGKFFATTLQIIFRPTAFFSGITTRGDIARAAGFGHLHWIIASLLFGVAGALHTALFFPFSGITLITAAGLLAAISYFSLWATTWLAVRLTAWEAAYRGYRLPLRVVMRGMYYHAAHYVPVGIIALSIVAGYHLLVRVHVLRLDSLVTYLYIICGAIIGAAAYLFKTYWIGMRNMMYANR